MEALDKAVQCAQSFRYHVVLDSPLKDHTSTLCPRMDICKITQGVRWWLRQ